MYDAQVPLDPVETTTRSDVGCVATAASQVLYYWNYPESIAFGAGDRYTSKGNHGNIRIDQDHVTYGFPTLAQLDAALDQIDYDFANDEKAALSFGVGVKYEMNYSSSGSWAYTSDGGDVFQDDFGFGSADVGRWSRNESSVIENIQAGWPVIAAIYDHNESTGKLEDGHSVIIDGYRDSDDRFYVNLGWGGAGDGWYDLPDIDAGGYHWDTVRTVVYNITPYQGWSQRGADSQNTMSTVYPIPTTEPAEKWEVEVPSDFGRYNFTHMVVGTSGKIYAAMSPMDLGQGQHPYICVISPHGHLEKLIPITDSDHGINHLTQNSRGEVFFGSSEWNNKTTIYKVNPKTDAVSAILNHTSPDRGIFDQPIKVDADDYLYFVIEAQFTANSATFYCRQPSGSARWSHAFSSNMRFYRSQAAIDEARDQVYLNYYDSSNQTSHLACFNRQFHQLKWTYDFPGTHRSSGMAGPPIVGPDGTVYVGCYTKVYAISPNGAKQWEQDFYPSYASGEYTRALGRDGTLYVAHGDDVGGDWHHSFISALDTADGGNVKWTEEVYAPQSEYDHISEVMVGGNGVVGFTYHHDDDAPHPHSDVWHTAALTDEGTGHTLLWDLEDYGGTMAFGPSQTFYVIPHTWADDSIFALSVGERGDPDGLGMAYTNNMPPAMPSNPSPADGSQDLDTSVTLSWEDWDPDAGHGLWYDVYLGGGEGDSQGEMLPLAGGIAGTSLQVDGLVPGESYVWRVVATDGQAITPGPSWSFSVTQELAEVDVHLAVVETPTATDTVSDLPASTAQVVEGHDFWVEAWVRSDPINPQPVEGGTVTLSYDTRYADALEIEHGGVFTDSATGIIADASGQVLNLGGTTTRTDMGDDEYVLLGRVKMVGVAPVDQVGHAWGPYGLGLGAAEGNTAFSLVGSGEVPSDIQPVPSAEVLAVVYDVNDSGRVDVADFSLFAPAFPLHTGDPEPPYTTWADFNDSGRVDVADFSLFAPVFGKYCDEITKAQLPPSAGATARGMGTTGMAEGTPAPLALTPVLAGTEARENQTIALLAPEAVLVAGSLQVAQSASEAGEPDAFALPKTWDSTVSDRGDPVALVLTVEAEPAWRSDPAPERQDGPPTSALDTDLVEFLETDLLAAAQPVLSV